MKDYTKFMKWALVYMIDRKTQDDRRSKLVVEGLFSSPSQIEDNYIIRNAENKHYIISVDDLEEFEDDKGVDRAARHFSDLINKGKVRKAEYIYS